MKLWEEFLDTPDKVLLVVGHIDEPVVWLAPPSILDKHLPSLHHLYVLIFEEWLAHIQVEEGSDALHDSFDVLRIGLELVVTDAFVHLW